MATIVDVYKRQRLHLVYIFPRSVPALCALVLFIVLMIYFVTYLLDVYKRQRFHHLPFKVAVIEIEVRHHDRCHEMPPECLPATPIA